MGANEKHRLRILAVEDNPDDAERVVLHLRRAFSVEYKRVEKASDFREAMTEDVWDVILCDYNLPDFNAFKALEIAQSHDENLPFIVVSGTIGESEAIALMDGGARDFVRKDNLSRLIPCIRRELRARDIWFRHLEAGKKLATSERRFRAFIEHTPTPIHLKDISGRYMIANRPFLSRF
ncbi:MAG: response regulator, partial [Rhodospirillales bacterium]